MRAAASPIRPIRWWPAALILISGASALAWVRHLPAAQFQDRNMSSFKVAGWTLLALAVWWLLFSRAPWRRRAGILVLGAALAGAAAATFRLRGMTGDFLPVFEPRWVRHSVAPPPRAEAMANLPASERPDFPQYLGPDRNGVLPAAPELARDWTKEPPQVLWRQAIGPAWSGFAIVGNRAVTLEQRDDKEVVICLNVLTGRLLWEHEDVARFATSLAGEGPRTTPTISAGRVYTLGATGILNCLALETGAVLWQRLLASEAPGGQPDFGYAGSALVHDGKVIVGTGQPEGNSLRAYRIADGEPVWSAGSRPISYSSPALCTLAGREQIVSFNMRSITAHDPATGAVLWEYPWGRGMPQIAQPVVVGADRLAFSSGYGVGCELLQIQHQPAGGLKAERVWKSLNLKAKMGSFFQRDGCLYGLDDGILSAVDLRDGSRRWKAGRYGHGQMLFVGDLLLVMAESGELFLLAPTATAPDELTRFRVFQAKTWNPPALSGDLLLVRTDQEAACLRLPVARSK